MVAENIESNTLYYVKDAPVIDRLAYAVFNPNNQKQELIKHALNFFNLEDSKVKRIY